MPGLNQPMLTRRSSYLQQYSPNHCHFLLPPRVDCEMCRDGWRTGKGGTMTKKQKGGERERRRGEGKGKGRER